MTDLSWAQIIQENEMATQQLEKLVAKLTDSELSTPMEAGWSVSAVLVHLAFWDMRATTLIHKWSTQGVGPSPIDTDVINKVTRELCLNIPPRTAAAFAVEKAKLLDQLIAGLVPEFVEKIKKDGTTVHLQRFVHRRMHMEEIKMALGRQL
jgi:hypothetical protein